jgi:quinol-cytochrome oxidoreductase complex cytochrome b subunit
VGEEALIRFYLLHVMILPLGLACLLAVHFWRVRKDGGLAHPKDAEERLGSPAADTYPVFTEAPAKTYHLAAMVRGRTPAVGVGPEWTLPSMPHLLYAEAAVLMVTLLICLALAIVMDAPLKELANPAVPENPAKAPWYFLGLQELVSYSAFMGGIGIPTIVLLGLGLIPYLDRAARGAAGSCCFPSSSGWAPPSAWRGLRSASAGCASGSPTSRSSSSPPSIPARSSPGSMPPTPSGW